MSTHHEDLKLAVGPELDAEVWRRVFGYTVEVKAAGMYRLILRRRPSERVGGRKRLPPLSTDLAGAWTVVEELRRRGWLWVVKEMPDGFPYLWDLSGDQGAEVHRQSFVSLEWMPHHDVENGHKRIWMHPSGMGASAPEAICRAALMALEEEADCPCRRTLGFPGRCGDPLVQP